MQRQSALCKPRLKSNPQRRGLAFRPTVTNRIIGIALEQYVREVPAHPQVERIVQKEIGQEGANDALNAKGNFRFERELRQWRSGRDQPMPRSQSG